MFSYKDFGHIARNCPKVCNYCKKGRHITKNCRVQSQNRHSHAFQATIQSFSSSMPPTVSFDFSILIPATVKQMIVSAFTAFNLQDMGTDSIS